MVHRGDQNIIDTVKKINSGSRSIRNLSVDIFPSIPVHKLDTIQIRDLYQAIVKEVFRQAGMQKTQARGCWDSIVDRLMRSDVLQAKTSASCDTWRSLVETVKEAVKLHKHSNKPTCITAPYLFYALVIIVFRKLWPRSGEVFDNHPEVAKLFGELNAIQWLPVAIKLYKKTHGKPFVIELDRNTISPAAQQKLVGGKQVWVVTVKQPAVNIYESEFRNIMGVPLVTYNSVIAKVENHDQPLPSIEPYSPMVASTARSSAEGDSGGDDAGGKADKDDSHDEDDEGDEDDDNGRASENEDDIIDENENVENEGADTLHDYARELRQLGKGLRASEQAALRRIRKGIVRRAKEADKKQDEVEFQRQLQCGLDRNIMSAVEDAIANVSHKRDGFDSYSHLKAL
ncbi:hypothetical protein F53441_12231 [Fusarium austroafricanum]|uniref:Uncharacterized protein n=1 Tax=Fusarium austroafricanum TaxID=2364996 RepID=A0A8H4NMH0_9HYPO|nr:hypothetical protein F53441_12231 [Fusarium austroafricanum]